MKVASLLLCAACGSVTSAGSSNVETDGSGGTSAASGGSSGGSGGGVVVKSPGLVDDFEDLDLINSFGGKNAVYHDDLMPPSSIALDLTVAGSTLPGGSPKAAARISGVMQANVGPQYPFCLFELPLNAPAGLNINARAPMRQLTFSYRAGPASVGMVHRVTLTEQPQPRPSGDYGWFIWSFTPTDLSWHKVSVHFPGYTGTEPVLTQSYGVPVSWEAYSSQRIYSVTFMTFSGPSEPQKFDLAIDDVMFE
ncbi:MAG TPA: hypothetical protein VMU50_05990 [Polyangia bacterium]|nr:hypothetical protein [Polyangia bacterium]